MSVRGIRWGISLAGGITFWLPDLVYHYVIKRSDASLGAIGLLNVGMPLGVVALYVSIGTNARAVKRSVALSLLFGTWLLGPAMVMLGWTSPVLALGQGD